MLVRDLMSADVAAVDPSIPVAVAARVMRDRVVGCLPVIENGQLIGMVTDRDVVERVAPTILLGKRDGLSRVDEFEERHVKETLAQLVSRSSAIAERVSAGTVALAGIVYHLADGRAALVDHIGDIGE